MRTAHLRVQEAEAALITSRLAYLPALNLNPQGTISSFDGSKAAKSYQLAVAASWEIDIFGRLTNAKEVHRQLSNRLNHTNRPSGHS